MAFWSSASQTRPTAPHDSLHVPFDQHDAAEPDGPPRDWKKIVLITGLATLSWVATYVGMLELIQSNMGDLPLLHKVIVGFSVAMLMTMIVWLLDQIFSPVDTFTKLTYVAGYIFLTLISVGFGFGFYWKVLESRSEAARSATSAVGQVQSSLHGASTRLEQLQATLTQLSAVSTQKAEIERTKGTSCPNSSPGDGPRRKMRDADAARFGFSSDFVKGRVGAVKGDMAALDVQLAKIVTDDPSITDPKTGTRNAFMRALGRRLDMTVTGFNAFRTDPQLRQIRSGLAARADTTTFPDGNGGTFACPDAQLQMALRGAVSAIDQLPSLEKPQIAAVEGSEATIEAFRRLTATFFGLMTLDLPPSADELRALQQRAVQAIENPAKLRALNDEAAGLSKRDYIPLGTAVFVDLCLLLVSIGRPMNRFVATRQSMLEAERGPVFPILSRFSEIHNHDETRRTFDVFREVIFESGGTYYVAVPLNAPRQHTDRDQLRRDAQTLANLCYALEGQGVLTQPWKIAPALVARRKLRRQGSKFIECYRQQQVAPVPRAWRALKSLFVSDRGELEHPAFRIYAFKRGAWPEMILGAVMGAANRVETERRYEQQAAARRAERAATMTNAQGPEFAGFNPDLPAQRAAPPDQRQEPRFSFKPRASRRHSIDAEKAAAQEETRIAAMRDEQRARAAPPRKGVATPDFRQRFGSYASHAKAELARYEEIESGDPAASGQPAVAATAPANSNTAPGAAPADIVVPFPAARPGKSQAQSPGQSPSQNMGLAERLAAALSSIAHSGDAPDDTEPTIDVEFRRETATLRVPVSQATLPKALTGLGDTSPPGATAASQPPQLEMALAGPETTDAISAQPERQALLEQNSDTRDPHDGPHDHDDQEEAGGFEPPLVLRRMGD
jgi:hypothetical protein